MMRRSRRAYNNDWKFIAKEAHLQLPKTADASGFAPQVLHFHIDDKSDGEVPEAPEDVPGLLEKMPIHVNGCFDKRTGTMSTILVEAGGGSKDTSGVIDETLINIISRCELCGMPPRQSTLIRCVPTQHSWGTTTDHRPHS